MNPQVPQIVETLEISSEVRENALTRAISYLRAHTAAAALALSCSMISPAQAEEKYTIQPAVYVIPDYSASDNGLNLSEVDYNALVDSFIQNLDSLERRADTEVVNGMTAGQILQGIKYSGNLNVLFDSLMLEFQNNGGDALSALVTIYRQMGELAQKATEHSEAITLARGMFINNSITQNPSYTEGRLARAPDDVKRERAGISFDHNLQAILGNNPEALTSEGLTEFVQYTREFTEVYLMSDLFAGEFPQEYLERALRIIESAERTAELAAEEERLAAEEAASQGRTAELAAEEERLAAEEAASQGRTAELAAEEERLAAESIRLFEQFREQVLQARSSI